MTINSLSFNSDKGKSCVVIEESSLSTSYPSLLLSGHQKSHHYERKDKFFEQELINPLNNFKLGKQFDIVNNSQKLVTNFIINLPKDSSLFSIIKFQSKYEIIIESIDGYSSWIGSFNQPVAGFIQFSFKNLPIWSRLAVFGRKNIPPTLTRYDILEYVKFEKSTNYEKMKKDLESDYKTQVSVEFSSYFESGNWFITLINDEEKMVPLILNISKMDVTPILCPNNCNGYGKCHQGKCHCFPGHIGKDCAESKF